MREAFAGRVEVWDIQQFLSSNVYEHSLLMKAREILRFQILLVVITKLFLRAETDPSLRIEFEAR